MTRKTIIILLVGLLFTPSAFGEQYLLNFSGEHAVSDQVVGYSGAFTFDSDADTRGEDSTDYSSWVTNFEIIIGGIMFDQVLTPVIAQVINNDPLFGDYFGVGLGLTNDSGDEGFIAVQFQDLTETIFSNSDFPTMIDLMNFGAFDAGNSNSTGVVFNSSMLGSEVPFFGALSSASLQPIPLPAGVWLFLSATLGLLGLRRR